MHPACTRRPPPLPAPLPFAPPARRRVYDQTGSVEDSEELAGEKFNELYNYYRAMYAKVGGGGVAAAAAWSLHSGMGQMQHRAAAKRPRGPL